MSISGLTLTAANYDEAVQVLKKRFGNRRQIIDKHMDALLKIEGVVSQHNVKGLRHLYDQVESHVQGLKSLGMSPESYGSLLASVFVSKLPQEIQLIITRKTGSDDWDLLVLMELVEGEFEARERNAATQVNPRKPPHRDQPTAAALFAGGSGNPGRGPTCSYCQ